MEQFHKTRRKFLIGASAAALGATGIVLPASIVSSANETVRLGVLKFGTVNWELNVIKHHGLDREVGLNLDVVGLANKDATTIAFNAGDVDMIVTDWIWTSRQRDAGADYTFVPYSVAAGSVMVHPNSGIESLMDLEGKKIGVAGSPIDKSWLLLRAYSIKTFGKDIEKIVNPIYAAPPLLNEKFKQKEFDAVLNYWNYTARLRAAGMKELIKVQDLLPGLGVPGRLPLIGYVFGETWGRTNSDTLGRFFHASRKARQIMLQSDAEWERLRPLTKAESDSTLIALRDGYRDGAPKKFDASQAQAIHSAFEIVAKYGGRRLVGRSDKLALGTLWAGEAY